MHKVIQDRVLGATVNWIYYKVKYLQYLQLKLFTSGVQKTKFSPSAKWSWSIHNTNINQVRIAEAMLVKWSEVDSPRRLILGGPSEKEGWFFIDFLYPTSYSSFFNQISKEQIPQRHNNK